jgi:hypothetical protein
MRTKGENWHCMVVDQDTNIEIDGVTCITRSRSWQIQMKDSRHIGSYNFKTIEYRGSKTQYCRPGFQRISH